MRRNIPTEYDLLIIDESSTVSNRDLRDILNKASFSLLVLVGDIYQIEAIQFGNRLSAAREFIPPTSVFELTKPYRSNHPNLLEFCRHVRNMEDTILELIVRQGYSMKLGASIFEKAEDEIIRCLNYPKDILQAALSQLNLPDFLEVGNTFFNDDPVCLLYEQELNNTSIIRYSGINP